MTLSEPDPIEAYIGIGSNTDDPARRVAGAFELLDAIPRTIGVRQSSLYRSAPLGPVKQPDFINAIAVLHTCLSAMALLRYLQSIERGQGREDKRVHWGPRVLDLDLLIYGDAMIDEPDLKVPHPGIAERNFVLLPLREIAPDLHIPGLG